MGCVKQKRFHVTSCITPLPEQSRYATIPPAGQLGTRLMAGQLPLEQLVVVRIHCPQHEKAWTKNVPGFLVKKTYGDKMKQCISCLQWTMVNEETEFNWR